MTAMNRKAYPAAEKPDDVLAERTVKRTPARVTEIPVTCIFDGFLLRITAEAISDTTGIHARKTPLSSAVVYLIPKVSPVK